MDLSFSGDAKSYNRNVFSGYYRVMTISNKIDKAKFTQKINLVRYDDSHDFMVGPPSSPTTPITNSQPNPDLGEAPQGS